MIRYGGDEFVIVLTKCEQRQVETSIKRFKTALSQIRYGINKEHVLSGDFGYAYTKDFKLDGEMMENMLNKFPSDEHYRKLKEGTYG